MPNVKKMTIEELQQEVELRFNGIGSVLLFRCYKPGNTIGARHIVRQVRNCLERIDRLVLELDARAAHGVVVWGDKEN